MHLCLWLVQENQAMQPATERQQKVVIPEQSHVRLRIFAAIHRITMKEAAVRAIDLLIQGSPTTPSSTKPEAARA